MPTGSMSRAVLTWRKMRLLQRDSILSTFFYEVVVTSVLFRTPSGPS